MVYIYKTQQKRKKNIFASLSINNILISLNVALFIIFLFVPINFIQKFVALDPFYILKGKYIWTFLTSMFMHVGPIHLFVNMISLFFVGSLVERIVGRKRYLNFYLIAGLLGGIFFVLFYFLAGNLNINVPAVGASGALFGLIGLLMLLTPNLRVYVMFIPIPIKLKYAAPGMLVILWLISVAGNIPIGNTAHLGGLITGLIYGIYIRYNYPNKIKQLNARFR